MKINKYLIGFLILEGSSGVCNNKHLPKRIAFLREDILDKIQVDWNVSEEKNKKTIGTIVVSALAQIILFLEMMKISKKKFPFLKEKRFVKENEESIAILENILFLEMKSSNFN